MTLAQVWAAYREAGHPRLRGVGHKRTSSVRCDIAGYRLHIEPRLGAEAVSEIDTAVARRWLDKIPSRGQRTMYLLLLKTLLSFTRTRGLSTTNPIAITADKNRQVQNFLTPDQLRALDNACVELSAEQPARMAGFVALRVLLYTGCRKSENSLGAAPAF